MIETAFIIVLIVAGAIIAFILVDKAEQPAPIPMILKLVILLLALFFIARKLGYAG